MNPSWTTSQKIHKKHRIYVVKHGQSDDQSFRQSISVEEFKTEILHRKSRNCLPRLCFIRN